MDETKLQIFQNALKDALKATEASLNKTEFLNAFKEVIAQVKKMEAELTAMISTRLSKADTDFNGMVAQMKEMRQAFQVAIDETRKANDSTFAQIKQRSLESIDAMFNKMRLNEKFDEMYAEHEAMMKECEDKMPDTEKMMKEMLAKIPETTPEQVRDKLEALKDDERLDKSAVKGLEDEIKALRKEIAMKSSGGGGTSALGVRQAFKYIAHTEAPVGDIDGVNKTYTVKNAIWWIAGFTINGEQVAQLPNFTYAGNTITFAAAIPAVYSGKDIECKYIG